MGNGIWIMIIIVIYHVKLNISNLKGDRMLWKQSQD